MERMDFETQTKMNGFGIIYNEQFCESKIERYRMKLCFDMEKTNEYKQINESEKNGFEISKGNMMFEILS